MSEIVPELTEDLEVKGPGKILAEAREKHALSQQDVADKLNFRVSLVSDIESDQFDQLLPATYNRGYLKNYAKLVNISTDDILTSYEMLSSAKTQDTEMLSFSKGTEKEAENNLLMWISYLILAVLVGLTIVWWLQGEDRNLTITAAQTKPVINNIAEKIPTVNQAVAEVILPAVEGKNAQATELIPNSAGNAGGDTISEPVINSSNDENITAFDNVVEPENNGVTEDVLTPTNSTNIESDTSVAQPVTTAEQTFGETDIVKEPTVESASVDVTFTFSGDCWVNIYDAAGERIAWGIKKLGYVMNISGQAPFNVTLGKPELVSVNFDGQSIDMSQFRMGQIAKFTLPIAP